jgi:hypothetical protein
MKKAVYAISGFVPSDEKVVVINIYKLIRFGSKIIRYGWISVNGEEKNGIGTCTDDFGKEDRDEAIFSIYQYLEEKHIVSKCTFEEAVNKGNEIKESLEIQYKYYLNN